MRLNEIRTLTLFHGDDYGTTVLSPQWMHHEDSNNQEGVGIYFSPDINTAHRYGSHVIKIELTPEQVSKIADSRQHAEKFISDEQGVALMQLLYQGADEEMWYLMTDYGMMISEPEDVEEFHVEQLWYQMKSVPVRNFQLELTHAVGPTVFVAAWNRAIPLIGTYDPELQFYAIIDTSIKPTPVNF